MCDGACDCRCLCPPEKTGVTRFPALLGWLHHFLEGKFPYGISSNPSAFPSLFFLAIPFYYLGNLGLLEVSGILIFGLIAMRIHKRSPNTALLILVILMLLPTTYYEVLTRSELFFNMSLVLAIVTLADEHLDSAKVNPEFFTLAVLLGLGLSTRSVVGVIYTVFVVFKFRNGAIKNGLLFSMTVMATFCLTIVPFMIWNMPAFLSHGPFGVQFAYVSGWTIVVALAASIIFGLVAKNLLDVIYYSGIVLFGLVSFAFAVRLGEVGFSAAIFKNEFDVGYFIFCVPFFLTILGTDTFAGSFATPIEEASGTDLSKMVQG